MTQEMLTLNWKDQRTIDELQVREYFTSQGWILNGDDVTLNDESFRLVDFGKANCLNFVSPLEELPIVVYDFILNLPDSPTITLGLESEHDTEILNTWSWKEFIAVIKGDEKNE